jgi:hypothetical protein
MLTPTTTSPSTSRSRSFLSPDEVAVMTARLASDEDATWNGISARVGISPNNCAVHWLRAIPKLRIFLLIWQPNLVGGMTAVRAGYDQALIDHRQRLLPLEAEAFRNDIIERRPPRRQNGWQEALRSATAKVFRYLEADFASSPRLPSHPSSDPQPR